MAGRQRRRSRATRRRTDPQRLEAESVIAAGTIHWRDRLAEFGSKPLPLEDATCMFILVNVLDIFATRILLSIGGSEANPVAQLFLERWGFHGMIVFKMAMIAFFCVATQWIGQFNLQKAKRLMTFGTTVVSCVVIYSAILVAVQISRN